MVRAIDNMAFFGAFFQTITASSLPRTVQHLDLIVHVGMFALLTKNLCPFKRLTKLSLELRDINDSSDQIESSFTLIPFFLSLGPTLELMHIKNNSEVDLSPLFDGLSKPTSSIPFPKLRSFKLETQTIESNSLHSFLLPHYCNLHHIKMRFRKAEAMDAWLTDFAKSNSRLLSLQTIHLNPATSQAGLSSLLTVIKSTSLTLSSLTILGLRLWTHEEAMQVIYALAEGDLPVQTLPRTPRSEFRFLKMTISHLSVPFLNLLAGKLPQLEELILGIYQTVGSDEVPYFIASF